MNVGVVVVVVVEPINSVEDVEVLVGCVVEDVSVLVDSAVEDVDVLVNSVVEDVELDVTVVVTVSDPTVNTYSL